MNKCLVYVVDTNGTTDHLNLSYVTVSIWRVKSIKNIQQIHHSHTRKRSHSQPKHKLRHVHTNENTRTRKGACPYARLLYSL